MKKIIIPFLAGSYHGIANTLMIWIVMQCIFGPSQQFQVDALSYVIFGIAVGGLSCLYYVDQLPLILQIVLHLGGSAGVFLVIAKYNQWLPMTFEATFWFFVVFIFIFFLIWQFYFIYHRYLVHKINRKISQN